MISHHVTRSKKVAVSIGATVALLTLYPHQARGNQSVFDMDPACGPIIAATRKLPDLTDYAEWPTRIENLQIKRPKWEAVPYTDHLDAITAWAHAASRTRRESWEHLYHSTLVELGAGQARFEETIVALSFDANSIHKVYGIERKAISRGPISGPPKPDFNRRYKLWSIILEIDRPDRRAYIPLNPGSDGSSLILVKNHAILVAPSLASVFSLDTPISEDIDYDSICPSIRTKNGSFK